MHILKTHNLSKSFNSNPILDGITLEITKGSVVSIIGPNGAGKTTLFNLISGFVRPDKGSIIYQDQNITFYPTHKINKLGISRTFQDLRLIKNITVLENVLLAMKNNPREKIYNSILPDILFRAIEIKKEEEAKQILRQTKLLKYSNRLAGEISCGQQKILTFACCISNQPDMLLLDEPVTGVNPLFRDKIRDQILELKLLGKTILLIEHNTSFCELVSDLFLFLHDGKLLCFKNIRDLRRNKIVKHSYL